MRVLIKAQMPVEIGNKLAKSGKLGQTVQAITEELKPEAAYFITENGKRTALFFVDMADPSQIPAMAEPLFLALDADVDLIPAMAPEDLAKAGPSIEAAVKKYA